MPELPEVETIRRQLEPLVSGRTIVEAWTFGTPKFADAPAAIGARITGVGRRGKYLLAPLHDDRDLVVHLGMTGRLWVTEQVAPVDDPFLRAWWSFDDGSTLVFRDIRRFGRIAVLPHDDHRALPTLAALGPEPFGSDFTPESLHHAVRRSRMHVKTQLLSQRVVAGVGNIYADEALWSAQVNPASRTLSKPKAARLHGEIVTALQAGIDNGGTTLRDYRAADGSEGNNQYTLRCYGRAGQPCLRCGEPLRRRVIDARSTTWCPTCQR